MGLFFREIAAFAGIVCDIEEIFVVGDLQVFPTTPPYRALVAVTHAPIERAFKFGRSAGQYRQQIDPVERVAGGRSNPGHRETGCLQVHRDGHLIGYAPRLDTAQQQICGTLRPPSSRSNLRPTNGQIFEKRSPPLSLVNTTGVLSSPGLCRTASSTRPMPASRDCIISP